MKIAEMELHELEVKQKIEEWDKAVKFSQTQSLDQIKKYEDMTNNLKRDREDLNETIRRKDEEINKMRIQVSSHETLLASNGDL